MEYQNLANQLRPNTFKDFIYNEQVVSVLKNMLTNSHIPNGILFSGVRGIGKTTLSRLFARALNCTDRTDEEPCGVCDNCKASLGGGHPDIIEISGSTHGNIDDIRKIIDMVPLTPMMGKYKVFIIDEVQGLGRSQSSFDALLKVLEEPPSHVVWLFCTTAKQKIPVTIKSRLVSLDLKLVPTKVISQYVAGLLNQLLEQHPDDIMYYEEAIARAANNSIRDALTILEKVIPYCQEKGWSEQNVYKVLGHIDEGKIQAMINCLVKRDPICLWSIFDDLLESGVEPDVLYEDGIVRIVSNLMLVSFGVFVDHNDLFLEALKQLTPPRVRYLANALLKYTKQYNESTNKKFVFQLLAIELCT
jgi:DNA polymerase-3 subunit gamma/tau